MKFKGCLHVNRAYNFKNKEHFQCSHEKSLISPKKVCAKLGVGAIPINLLNGWLSKYRVPEGRLVL